GRWCPLWRASAVPPADINFGAGRIFYIGRPHGQEMPARRPVGNSNLDNGYEGSSGLRSLRQLACRLAKMPMPGRAEERRWLETGVPMSSLTALTAIHEAAEACYSMASRLLDATGSAFWARRLPLAATAAPASTDSTPAAGESPFRPLYLDLQATTPLDPSCPGRHAALTCTGCSATRTLAHTPTAGRPRPLFEKARAQVGQLIGADPKEIVFTSESNNIAIKGVARFYKSRKRHLITSQTEHKCVLDSLRALESRDSRFACRIVPCFRPGRHGASPPFAQAATPLGLLDLGASLESPSAPGHRPGVGHDSQTMKSASVSLLKKDTAPSAGPRAYFFHTDAAQALANANRRQRALHRPDVDLRAQALRPQKVSALSTFVGGRASGLEPLQSGGGQPRRGMRLAHGAQASWPSASAPPASWRKRWLRCRRVDGCPTPNRSDSQPAESRRWLNGDRGQLLPGALISASPAVEGESLLMALKDRRLVVRQRVHLGQPGAVLRAQGYWRR
uniref:Cysteine desulfurase, mitochondrial n=1 Tax=Macrostomum lignano TaxID=282301 RepID=A0A1I8FBT0_9PLAT